MSACHIVNVFDACPSPGTFPPNLARVAVVMPSVEFMNLSQALNCTCPTYLLPIMKCTKISLMIFCSIAGFPMMMLELSGKSLSTILVVS